MVTRGHLASPRACSWSRMRRSPSVIWSSGHDLEAEALVVGSVPGEVGVGGQRQGRQPLLLGPRRSSVQQCFAKTLSRMVRMHGDLFDMGVSIHHVEQKVRHRIVRIVGDDPGSTALLESGQLGNRGRFIVCHGGQALSTWEAAVAGMIGGLVG